MKAHRVIDDHDEHCNDISLRNEARAGRVATIAVGLVDEYIRGRYAMGLLAWRLENIAREKTELEYEEHKKELDLLSHEATFVAVEIESSAVKNVLEGFDAWWTRE